MSGRTINMELGEFSRAIFKPWSILWPKVRKLEERQDIGQALSPEQERRLLDTAASKKHWRMGSTMIRGLLLTGMRSGEFTGPLVGPGRYERKGDHGWESENFRRHGPTDPDE